MLMTQEQKNFIQMIGNAALMYYPEYKILPSLTIAQAIKESNWGMSGLSETCFNYFGMKWTTGCGCAYKEYSTKEQLKNGKYVTIVAKFRRYANANEGIRGYYEFLNYKRYKNLRGVTDYRTACDLIQKDGWATSHTYAESLKNDIEYYGLLEWDAKALGGKMPDRFIPGTYTVISNGLKVRSGAGMQHSQKLFSEMTEAAQKQNPEYRDKGVAAYKKGTRFTAKRIIKVSDQEYWAETPSGYVCLMKDGTEYVK